uniref:Uncharacterized protein n=1 Tax=Cucumis melo TaxID=3656 RepID=A0A9I9EFU7_CUCME
IESGPFSFEFFWDKHQKSLSLVHFLHHLSSPSNELAS